MARSRTLLTLAVLASATALTFDVFSRTDPACAASPIATFDAAPGKCSAFSTRGDVFDAAIVAVGVGNCVSGASADVYARVRTANSDTTGGSLDGVLDCAPRDSGAWLETYAVGRGVMRECSPVVDNDYGETVAYVSITNATCESGTPYVLAQFEERACSSPSGAVTYSFTNPVCDQYGQVTRTGLIAGDSLNVSYAVANEPGACFAAPMSAAASVLLADLASASSALCFDATPLASSESTGINNFGSFSLYAAASFTAPPSTELTAAALFSAFFSCTESTCGLYDVVDFKDYAGSTVNGFDPIAWDYVITLTPFSVDITWQFTSSATTAFTTFFSLIFFDGAKVRAVPLDGHPSGDSGSARLDMEQIVSLAGCSSMALIGLTLYDPALEASAGVTLANTLFSRILYVPCPVEIRLTAPASAQVCDDAYGCYTAPLAPVNGGADVFVNFTTNSPPGSELILAAEYTDTNGNYILYDIARIQCVVAGAVRASGGDEWACRYMACTKTR